MTPSQTEPFVFSGVESSQVNHLPIVRAYADEIGLVDLLNDLVPNQMSVDIGTIVLGLIFDTLSGRSPLYHLEDFFKNQDRELLFGKEIPASTFNDDNVGHVLDKLYAFGTEKIYSAMSLSAIAKFDICCAHVHFDTTSVNVYGDYLQSASANSPFEITHGYSKDKRPDLKQFIVGMLCVGGNVPLLGSIHDGNASDKPLNNEVLSRISNIMASNGVAEKEFVYISDSQMVTEANLKEVGEHYFITRLPHNYSECDAVIDRAVESGEWAFLGTLSEEDEGKARPRAIYHTSERSVVLYEKAYRAVVIHSSQHDKRRQQRLERELQKSTQALEKEMKLLEKPRYFCRKDAEQAALQAGKLSTNLHFLHANVLEIPIYERGRPKKDGSRTIKEIQYQLRCFWYENEETISQLKWRAGCFVMLTNIPREGEFAYSSTQVLKAYKEQHGVEHNFGFLKDDAIVNAIFLKKPERIEAIGLIFLMALLLWRLMEYRMRRFLRACLNNLN